MKRARSKKALSFVLVVVLITSLCGFYVQAEDGSGDTPEIVTESFSPDIEAPGELPSEEPSTEPSEEPGINSDAQNQELSEVDTPELIFQSLSQTLPDSVTVEVSGNLPAGIELRAEAVDISVEEGEVLYAYDITLWLDGAEYSITEAVTVSFLNIDLPDTESIEAYHIDGDEVEQIGVIASSDEGTATMTAESFSIYALVGNTNIKDSYTLGVAQQLALTNYSSNSYSSKKAGTWSITSGSDVVSFVSASLTNTNTVTIKGDAAGTAIVKCVYSEGVTKTNTFSITVTNNNYGYLGTVDHIDIRIENATLHITQKVVDQNGDLISSTANTITGYVSRVTSATLDLSVGSDVNVTSFSKYGDYEYRGSPDFNVQLANLAGVSAIVDIAYTEGGVLKTLEDVHIVFSPADITEAIENCNGFSNNIPDGLDFSIDSSETLTGTQTLTSALTITKTFTGLSSDELAAIANDFTITVQGTSPGNSSDTYTKHLSDATLNGGVYTWTFTEIKTGNYGVSESGYANAAISSKYNIVSEVNGATGSSTTAVVVAETTARVAFTNVYTPKTVSVGGEKLWDVPEGFELPESVTVELLKNGSPYPTPLFTTATEDSDWKYSFGSMPIYDGSSPIVYSVRETKIGDDAFDANGRVLVYGTHTASAQISEVLGCWVSTTDGYDITNTYYASDNEGTGSFYLRKLISGTETRLAGATFTLSGGDYQNTQLTNGTADILFGNLQPGEYTLTEVSAPTGYTVSSITWTIIVTETGKTLVSVDSPETGNVFINIWSWFVDLTSGSGLESGILTIENSPTKHNVVYQWSGSHPSDAVLPDAASYSEGDPVTIAQKPSTELSHWTFKGWTIEGSKATDFEMGTETVTIVGSWEYSHPYYPPDIVVTPTPSPTEIAEESPPLEPSPSISPEPSVIPEPETPQAVTPVTPTETPQTGDDSNLVLMAILATLSVLGLGTIGLASRRKKRSR